MKLQVGSRIQDSGFKGLGFVNVRKRNPFHTLETLSPTDSAPEMLKNCL